MKDNKKKIGFETVIQTKQDSKKFQLVWLPYYVDCYFLFIT